MLDVIYAKLDETGKWLKSNPKDAASILANLWNIEPAAVEEANSHRSYKVGVVTPDGLSEQQRIADTFRSIADTFRSEGVLPTKVDASSAKIWSPRGS